MKKYNKFTTLLFFLTILFGLDFVGNAQEGFRLPEGQSKDRINFELINNLVIVPVEVNGTPLSFLLDTGVNSTLLFSLSEADSVELNNVKPVKIKGLGDGGDIAALGSINNKVKIGDAVDNDHELYVIFDDRINFSPRMGVPVHGVIGYDFFRDFVVKTSYVSEVITIYDPKTFEQKKCTSCATLDLVFKGNKPYVELPIRVNDSIATVDLLVDSGASDALWLFDEDLGVSEAPKNYFNDFLGLGLSGGVYGKRSKLEMIKLGGYSLRNVNVAFPDSIALRNLRKDETRSGTLGSDILRRFTVVMNYSEGKLTLQKNRLFSEPFNYNMAGLIIEHDGMVPVKDVKRGGDVNRDLDASNTAGNISIELNTILTFFLAPKLVVAEVRKDSPAAISGILKNDEVLSINGRPAHAWELFELTRLFSSKSGKKITVEVNREGMVLKKRFYLKEVL